MSSLTLSIIQTNLHWEDKAANLQMLTEKVNSIREKTELIILPEMFNTGFSMKPDLLAETMDGVAVTWMKNISAAKRCIVTGSLMIKENDVYVNRMVWMLPNGQYGYYDKRHLFAMGDEHKYYKPGNRRLIAQVKGWKINLQVCYDLRFPIWARQAPSITTDDNEAKEFEYDLLLYVANWPDKRNHAWKTLLQARAIENQSFVVGVNRVGTDGNGLYHSGDSMVVNAMGEVLYTKADDEDIFTITINKSDLEEVRTKLPFWKDADPFKILE